MRCFPVGAYSNTPVHYVEQCDMKYFPVGAYCNTSVHNIFQTRKGNITH
ncbi:hypothetical protein [Capnocytophaga canimorsus]|nr:hypothetical protein [Capnocytophaga canimorsus]